jgi:hypothetical protein
MVTRERHLPSLVADARVRVVGVVDRHPERAGGSPAFGCRIGNVAGHRVGGGSVHDDRTPPADHAVHPRAIDRGWHCPRETAGAAGERAAASATAGEQGLVLAVAQLPVLALGPAARPHRAEVSGHSGVYGWRSNPSDGADLVP